ncbi:hypothetical protein ACWEN6_01050 [Sphaerisporangium sp. NPDC004334]
MARREERAGQALIATRTFDPEQAPATGHRCRAVTTVGGAAGHNKPRRTMGG